MNTLYNRRNGKLIADKVQIARTWFQRFRGLLGRSSLDAGEALVITRCSSVHMFFMRFPIDVLFCSKTFTVVGKHEHLRPWRMSQVYFASKQVIELPSGTISSSDIKVGDELELR